MFKKIKTKKIAKNILVTGLLISLWAFAVTADYSSLSKTTGQTLTAANWTQLVDNVKWLITDSNGDVIVNQNLKVESWIVEALAFQWDWSLLTGLDSLVWATGATWEQWIQGIQWEQGEQWIQWEQWLEGPMWLTWATWSVWPQWEQGLQWFTGATWPAWTTSWVEWDWVFSTDNKVHINWNSNMINLKNNLEEDTEGSYLNYIIWEDKSWDMTYYLWDGSTAKRVLLSARWSNNDYPLDFEVGGSWKTRMRITPDWNIWIWTSTPLSKLHVTHDRTNGFVYPLLVEDSVKWTSTSLFAWNPGIGFNYIHDGTTSKSYKSDMYASEINMTPLDWKIHFKIWDKQSTDNTATTLLSEPLTLTKEWNVWIWTTEPKRALHINNALWLLVTSETWDTPTSLNLQNNQGRWHVTWPRQDLWSEWDLRFYKYEVDDTSYIIPFVLKNNWNVWIWTTEPTEKLHVSWDMLVQGQDIFLSTSGDNNNDSISYNDWSVLWSSWVFTFLSDTVKRAEYTEPTAAISAKGAYFKGNVWVWTTSPSEKLQVEWNVKVSNLAGSWNAYVCVDSDGVLYRSATACN